MAARSRNERADDVVIIVVRDAQVGLGVGERDGLDGRRSDHKGRHFCLYLSRWRGCDKQQMAMQGAIDSAAMA